jgi:prepilin-type N-terminal cleavage/methylation domain-containing protein
LEFRRPRRRGFTLVEMLVAVAITLIMMTTVVTVFGLVMDSISNSRATIEMTDRLRGARNRLALDLQGATAPMTPPISPDISSGYFEYIEGPIGAIFPAAAFATRSDEAAGSSGTLGADYTVGDNDDVLMLTVRSTANEPFTGRFTPWNYAGTPTQPPPYTAVGDPVIVQSRVAEVSWFLRGTTLYRRVLLVLPGPVAVQPDTQNPPRWISPQPIPPRPLVDSSGSNYRSFYALYDVSARQEDGPWGLQATAGPNTGRLVANTLADLTKRENRFGHQPYAWPHDARFWGPLRLPTLRECSSPLWPFPWNDFGNALPAQMGVAITSPLDPAGRPLIVPNGVTSTALSPTQVPAVSINPYQYQYPPTVQLTPDGTIPVPPATGSAIAVAAFDAWRNPTPYNETRPLQGQSRTGELTHYILRQTGPDSSQPGGPGSSNNAGNDERVSEDIILTNVLEFDIKVWDPGAPVVTVSSPVPGGPTIVVSPNESWDTNGGGSGNAMWADKAAMVNAGQLRLLAEGGVIAGFGAFVDLNYFATMGAALNLPPYYPPTLPTVSNTSALQLLGMTPSFYHAGDFRSGVRGTHPGPTQLEPMGNTAVVMAWPSAIYDTWSTHYEQDGINQRITWDGSNWPNGNGPIVDAGSDGLDNDLANGADDPAEQEAPPPYSAPLRAIQIKIRVFDPDSRQVREVTLEHEFLPES